MCCRCCTSLKVAGIWGSSIQMVLGSILLLQFFVLPEDLGEYYNFYLVYMCVLSPLGALILLAVFKEIGWLLKITSTLFIAFQLYGLSIRLMLPLDTTETYLMLFRIVTLFIAIVLTAVYSFILILFSRKLAKAAREAAEAARQAALDAEDLEAGSGGVCDGSDTGNAATAL